MFGLDPFWTPRQGCILLDIIALVMNLQTGRESENVTDVSSSFFMMQQVALTVYTNRPGFLKFFQSKSKVVACHSCFLSQNSKWEDTFLTCFSAFCLFLSTLFHLLRGITPSGSLWCWLRNLHSCVCNSTMMGDW